MAATIPDVTVPSDQFVSINTLSGVAAGTAITIQLKGSKAIRLIESNTQPAANVTDGLLITTLQREYAITSIPLGALEVWAICIKQPSVESVMHTKLNVQEL